MTRLRVFAILLLLVVAGCASPERGQSAGQLWQQESDGIAAKFRWQMETNKALDPIRGKVALYSPRDIKFEMLANTDRPTSEERAAILVLARIREESIQEQRAVDEKYQNPFRRVSEAQRQAVSAVWADLYNGAITYGESARKRQEIDAATTAAREQLRTAMAAEAAAIEQASIQRLNNYLLLQQTLQQQRQTQIPPLQTNQTIRLQTTCYTVGNMVFCQ
jgi:hypothetical protein